LPHPEADKGAVALVKLQTAAATINVFLAAAAV